MDLLAKLLHRMREWNATDLLINPGTSPSFRIDGKLQSSDGKSISATQLEKMARLVMNADQFEEFSKDPEANVGVSPPNLGRFRINIYRERGDVAMAIRAIPLKVPNFSELDLPPVLQQVAMLKRGLVIVAGSAGSGKSTSMAAMMSHRSRNDLGHIITIEDPIEYEIPHAQSVVSQREIGTDTLSYQNALHNALRQSPDVLMIGEARERETLESALEFADTGHLCITTVHANSATQTFDRIINLFREEEREQILISLANNVKAIVCQNLIPSVDGSRVLAFELLLSTPRISELIRKGQFWELREAMEKANIPGMQSYDETLFQLFSANRIDEDTALQNAYSVNNLRLRMKLASRPGIKMQSSAS